MANTYELSGVGMSIIGLISGIVAGVMLKYSLLGILACAIAGFVLGWIVGIGVAFLFLAFMSIVK